MTKQEKVAHGAAWLDYVNPNWRHSIDLEKLDQKSMHNCIIGQLYNSWTTCPDFLEVAVNCYALGFDQKKRKHAKRFTKLWKKEVKKRNRLRSFIPTMALLASGGKARRKAWKKNRWIQMRDGYENWSINETDTLSHDWVWKN